MTINQQQVEQPQLLAATSPWLAQHFSAAFTLLDELDGAASCSDFAPECLDDGELDDFTDRLNKLFNALPSEHDDVAPPLETAVLGRALFMLEEFLQREAGRRKDDSEYATYCQESNELRRYRDANNGEWPKQGGGR